LRSTLSQFRYALDSWWKYCSRCCLLGCCGWYTHTHTHTHTPTPHKEREITKVLHLQYWKRQKMFRVYWRYFLLFSSVAVWQTLYVIYRFLLRGFEDTMWDDRQDWYECLLQRESQDDCDDYKYKIFPYWPWAIITWLGYLVIRCCPACCCSQNPHKGQPHSHRVHCSSGELVLVAHVRQWSPAWPHPDRFTQRPNQRGSGIDRGTFCQPYHSGMFPRKFAFAWQVIAKEGKLQFRSI